MPTDPSEPEGRRTASAPAPAPESPAVMPEAPAAASFRSFGMPASPRPQVVIGWLLVAAGVLIGFGMGSAIGSTDDPGYAPATAVAELTPEPVPEADLAPSTSAEPVVREDAEERKGAEEEHYRLASHGVGERLGGEPDRLVAALDDRPHQQLVAQFAAVPIEALPVYRDPATRSSTGPRSTLAALDASPERRASTTGGTASLTVVTRGRIKKGESLGTSLRRQGIAASTVHLIASEMRGVFDFRHSRPGDEYRLGQDADGRVLDFRYVQGPEESYYLAWQGTRYVAKKESAELRPELAKIAGIVDSSFYGAVLALGEQSALASQFARILAWDIDFSRNVHPGDEFQILYERLYRRTADGEDVYVKPGRILAGRYDGRGGEYTVVYFEDEQGHGSYFRPDGSSVERAFLAAPLEFSRITSRFTRARHHPILKVTRPHLGIDYAAPRGTPIWAVADGVVEFRGRAGASGNLVRIRHANGITSHYAHLSRFASGLEVGDRVDQKQVIGYVGSTGLSTGPHVCFRVKRNGRYVDPMKIEGPAGAPVEPERLAVFHSVRDRLLADLGPGPVSLVDEAL